MNRLLPLTLYIMVFILILTINFHFPQWVLLTPYANWLAVIACLVLLLTTKRHLQIKVLANAPQKRLPQSFLQRHRSLLQVILLQLFLLLTYLLTITLFYQFTFPLSTQAEFEQDLSQLASQLSFAYGAFPWTLYAILTLAFAQRFYNEKDIVSLSRVIRPLVPHRKIGIVSIAAHVYFRTAVLLGLSITMGMFALFLTQQTLQHWHMSLAHGLNLRALLMMSALTLPLSQPWGPQLMQTVFKHCRLGSIIVLVLCFSSLMLLAANGLFVVLADFFANVPYFVESLKPPFLHQAQRQHDLLLLTLCWWLAFAMPFCWYAARISAGKRSAEVLVSVLGLPLLLILASVIPGVPAAYLLVVTHLHEVPYLLLGFILLSMGFLALFFNNKRNVFGICSTSKKRLSFNATQNFMHNSVFILAVFLLLRFNMIYYLSVVLVVMCLLYLLTCVLAFLKHLYCE